jgi:lambda repressor-like predicted transcriptional regulator
MHYPVANEDIRTAMKAAGLPMWRVARSLGIAENTLSRWLRVDLEPANPKRALILDAITIAAQEAEQEVRTEDVSNC